MTADIIQLRPEQPETWGERMERLARSRKRLVGVAESQRDEEWAYSWRVVNGLLHRGLNEVPEL